MRKVLLSSFILLAVALASWTWMSSAPAQTASAPAVNTTNFRITFGVNRVHARDYSASLALSTGKVVSLTPWRFFGGDAISGISGWKLEIKRALLENQPDDPVRLQNMGRPNNLVPEGVDVAVDAPATATATVQSAQFRFSFRLADLDYRRALSFENGDVTVQPIPATQSISSATGEEHDYPSLALTSKGAVWVAWQAYKDLGDHVYARSTATTEPVRLTDQKGDVFGTAVAEDAQGRIWVVWSERTGQVWDLYARSYDGRSWSARRKLTSGAGPNMFHRFVRDPSGVLHLVWIGYQGGQSHVMWSKYDGRTWSQPAEVSGPSAWAPDGAVDSKGNLYVVWDSYRTGNYDIFYRRIGADGAMGTVQQLTQSPAFQSHPTAAVDKQGRLWVAWDESGANWGKDWSHDDPFRGTVLYRDRRPQVAVLDNGTWKRPEGDLMAAVPLVYNRYIELPRITCDAAGRIWLTLQIRTSSGMNRADQWASNGHWEHFLTTLEGDHWTPLMPVSQTSSRPEGRMDIQPAAKGVWMAWTDDNRAFAGRRAPLNQIMAASFDGPGAAPAPKLVEFHETQLRSIPVHPNEPSDVQRIRGYRTSFGGATLQILRGDFHRHTEISGDGAGDGSVTDYFRYMLDAAEMDTGIISDHNAGNDNEYTWWRTEKAIDLYLIPGRYTPLFGYERSVPYPNGHRNVVFPERGVRTLPVNRQEAKGVINSGSLVYPYLRQHRGICMLHSLATGQGSDYRDNDPQLEPLVELYQGYHASYEYEGAPRAETANYIVSIHGGYRPAGFWWKALAKGLKLGVESSSDHIATHNSYTMIYTPSATRADIVESMRKRHAYGATDNIIIDFHATDSQGREHFMGDEFSATAAPKLSVKVIGTDTLTHVEIVKDQKFIFRTEPGANTTEFTFVDKEPGNKESYYYVRVIQIDRNLAWSSPIWVNYSR